MRNWVNTCFALSTLSGSPLWLKQASSTDSSGSNLGCCSRKPTFISRRNMMLPLSTLSLPESSDSRVDLPVPFFAISPTCCPSPMEKDMSSNRTCAPKRLETFCTSSNGVIFLFLFYVLQYVFYIVEHLVAPGLFLRACDEVGWQFLPLLL